MNRLKKDAPEAFSAFQGCESSEQELYMAQYASLSASIQKRMLEAFEKEESQLKRFVAWKSLAMAEEDDPEEIRKQLQKQFGEAD